MQKPLRQRATRCKKQHQPPEVNGTILREQAHSKPAKSPC